MTSAASPLPIIRAVTAADLPTLYAWEEAHSGIVKHIGWSQLVAAVRLERALVAAEGRRIVAVGAAENLAISEWWIVGLVVDLERERRGIGRAMVEALSALAPEPCASLSARDKFGMVGFLRALGFLPDCRPGDGCVWHRGIARET